MNENHCTSCGKISSGNRWKIDILDENNKYKPFCNKCVYLAVNIFMTNLPDSHLDHLEKLNKNRTQGKWESDNRAMIFNPRKQNPFHESGAGININQNIEICIGGMQDEQGGAIGFLKNEDAECAAEAVNALSKLIFYAKHFLSIQKEIAVKNSG